MSSKSGNQIEKKDFSANGQQLVLDVSALNTARFEFSGTYNFTAVFESSSNSTNGTDGDWFPLSVATVNGNTVVTQHSTTNATQAYEANCINITKIRVRLTAFTSATLNSHRVAIAADSAAIEPNPVAQLAAGGVTVVGSATPGTTVTSVNSAASTNAALAKGSAAQLYAVTINNTTAAAKFVRFYNKATAPTVGTDTPVVVITVPANSSKEVEFGQLGKRFATGLGHAITNGATVLDATAVAAGDVQLSYDWI